MTTLVKGPDDGGLLPGPPPGGKAGDAPRAWRARRRQLGLRHLMGLSVVLGIMFAGIAQAIRTEEPVDIIIAALTIGLGISALGAFLALRLERWGIVGWVLVCIGPTSVAVVLVASSMQLTVSKMSELDPWFLGAVVLYVLPVLIGTVVHIALRLRAAHQDALVWVLALAADRDRPLGPALAALADQSIGPAKVRVLRVAECLDSGLSLPDALEFVPRSVPASTRLLVRVGHDSGAMVEALRDAATGRSARPPGWVSFGTRVSYLCLVLICIQSVTTFVLYFVIPKFEAIYRDFGVSLPVVTRQAIRWGNLLGLRYALPSIAAIESLILLYIPFAFAGFAELSVPFIDRLFLRRHSVLILRCLAMIVEGGRPIGPGLQTMARSYPTAWVRERLAGVALATDHGLDWVEALRRFALISRTDVALLESARRAGNLPWALRELADGSARRLGYRLQAVGHVLMTLGLLTLGGFVAFIGDRLLLSPGPTDPEARRMTPAAIGPRIRRRRRRGYALVELTISMLLFAAALAIVVQSAGWLAAQRRGAERRERAILEAANLMERLASRPWDELTPDLGRSLSLSPAAAASLRDGALEVAIAPGRGEPASKSIAITIRWGDRPGIPSAPVRLVAWVHRRASDGVKP